MSLGERIRKERQQKGLTKVELAKRVGISHIQLARYEVDKSKPSTAIIQKIANILETSTDYLIGGIEPRRFAMNEERLTNTVKNLRDLPDFEKWIIAEMVVALKNKVESEKNFLFANDSFNFWKKSSQ